MTQRCFPVVYMRGGTSRALVFHERDLPPAGHARDEIFCAALGSPDPYQRQLNGMGGGTTSLSKVAIIGPPTDPRADVDYTFGQVDVLQPMVSYRGNCGNISAAVGPFAVDEGLVSTSSGPARLVIHNTNTRKLIEARFAVTNGRADVAGDFALDGVAGTAAAIELAFLEVDVLQPMVSYRGNCGNISAAVGPFAVDEGLVSTSSGPARVVIHNTNTRKLIEARFAVTNGRADVAGDFALDGVAGTAAAIELAFLEPGGAGTGKLLPTGATHDTLTIPGLGEIQASIVDAANPTVFVRAEELGLTGAEKPADIAANLLVMASLRHVRAVAAVAAGLIADPAEARTALRNLPLVCILSPARDDGAGPSRIKVRMLNADQPHAATPLTGALCLAVAAQLPGTLVAETMRRPKDGSVLVEHAAGTLAVKAVVSFDTGAPEAREAVVFRTARRLMDGRVYIP